ncbi:hypothetical protein H9P43_003133 [Blastocladiella emersonii ATCC 22665]|nr:hypothetical protein H9P43_003133 [Blastocladiella emersonii ATCC 22665]
MDFTPEPGKKKSTDLLVDPLRSVVATAELSTPTTPPIASDTDARAGLVHRRVPGSTEGLLHAGSVVPAESFATSPKKLASAAVARAADPLRARLSRKFTRLAGRLHLSVVQAAREARRNKGQYLLGFSVVFVVVVTTAVLMAVAAYSTLIFVGLAEYSAGEIDLVVEPSDTVSSGRLNYTRVAEILPSAFEPAMLDPSTPPYLHAPRLPDLEASVFAPGECTGFNASQPYEATYPYTGMPANPDAVPADQQTINATRATCNRVTNCLELLCARALRTKLQLIDSDREAAAGIGRTWNLQKIPRGSVVLLQDLAANLRVGPGDVVFLSTNLPSIAAYQQNLAAATVRAQLNRTFTVPSYASTTLALPLRVHAVIADSLGKTAQDRTGLSFLEYGTVIDLIADHLHPWYSASHRAAMAATAPTVYHQVAQVVFTRQLPRFSSYLASDFATIAKALLEWSSDVRLRLGFIDTDVSLPVLGNLQNASQLSLFVNLIMSLIIIILAGLSAFLVYCLLMVSVETRTFELAILRMVGMQRPTVLMLILAQAMSYSIPALVVGLVAAQIAFATAKRYLEDFLHISISANPPASSISLALVMALVVPVLSSILPIRKALSLNLHDALDRQRPSFKPMTITIERSKAAFDPLLGVIGAVLTALGFGIYYFLPLALLSNDLALLFNIFLAILVGMITGLVVVTSNFLQLLEQLFTRLIFAAVWFENRSMATLVDRNLLAHRGRNKKTSMLYCLSLAFIVFISVTANIEVGSLQYGYRRNLGGCDFVVYSDYLTTTGAPYPIAAVAALEAYADANPVIAGYAWSTWALEYLTTRNLASQISNYGRVDVASALVRGVSPNFFDLTGTAFLQVDQYDRSPGVASYSPSEMLYTAKGTYSAVVGTYYEDQYSLQSAAYDRPFLVTARTDGGAAGTLRRTFPRWPAFFAKTSPVFTLSNFPGKKQDVLVSLPAFLNMTGGAYRSVTQLPMRSFYVKLVANATAAQYRQVKRELLAYLTVEDMLDIKEQLRGSVQAMSALSLIFDMVTALVMVITFFSLNTSFYVNVTEQSKEIGILRALGVGRLGILRLYFYESLVLVLSSVILGCSIGAAVGWTMAAQRTVLTEIPITMEFPVRQVAIIVLLSIASAIASTVGPVYLVVFKRKLVRILRE